MNEASLVTLIREIVEPTQTTRIKLGIGDDAAAWQPSRSHRSVVSTDMLVDGVHFLSGRMPADAIGHKALAVNLSDLAAMGARPVLATVALGLADTVDEAWVESFYRGMADLARRHEVAIVGGDLSRSPVTTIAITVVGEAGAQRMMLRSGARPNDILAVTGPLGASRAGLEVLLRRANPADGGRSAFDVTDQSEFDRHLHAALDAHLRPAPRIREGRMLAASQSVHAMMDISDGLAVDLRRMLAASGCGACLDHLPVSGAAKAVAERLASGTGAERGASGTVAERVTADAAAWALGGGEDYELLVAISARSFITVARAFKNRFQRELIAVGICEPASGLRRVNSTGEIEVVPAAYGWDHFGL